MRGVNVAVAPRRTRGVTHRSGQGPRYGSIARNDRWLAGGACFEALAEGGRRERALLRTEIPSLRGEYRKAAYLEFKIRLLVLILPCVSIDYIIFPRGWEQEARFAKSGE